MDGWIACRMQHRFWIMQLSFLPNYVQLCFSDQVHYRNLATRRCEPRRMSIQICSAAAVLRAALVTVSTLFFL